MSSSIEDSPMTVPMTFAVCWFKRVFHTEPTQDHLTLQQLTEVLQTFDQKPDVQRQIDRELRRIEQAWEAFRAGRPQSGRYWSELHKAERAAQAAGDNVEKAVTDCHRRLTKDAEKRAKKGLRLWSPTLYRPGSRRGSESVVHLSCLVLDYDDNTPIDQASSRWLEWFHVLHTTWSHRPDAPRFRIVLPLARPVLAEDWPQVWTWAEAQSERTIDPSCKGAARVWALPTVPSKAAPQRAFAHAGSLLDPLIQGLVRRSAPMVSVPIQKASAPPAIRPPWGAGDPADDADDAVAWADEVTVPPPSGPDADDDDFVDPFAEEEPGEGTSRWAVAESDQASTEASFQGASADSKKAEKPAADVASWTLDDVGELLLQLLERLEVLAEAIRSPTEVPFVDALERLSRLHESGALTDEEYRRAKGKLFIGPDAAS